jgi:hypothetical protein
MNQRERELELWESGWPDEIPDEEWAIYREAMDAFSERGIPFLLGGAFALATYTGRWRNTKDLDVYIRPQHREAVVDALAEIGFEDYFGRQEYQRHWIYRGFRDGILVDAIWAMANRRAMVDDEWFEHAPALAIRGMKAGVVPPEEMVWGKLYVLQKDRCDWPDLLNILEVSGPALDWRRLLDRLEADTPLLAAALQVFAWLSPERARELPSWVWEWLRIPLPGAAAPDRNGIHRMDQLDSRPWFGPGR